jgi:hypothetical protein
MPGCLFLIILFFFTLSCGNANRNDVSDMIPRSLKEYTFINMNALSQDEELEDIYTNLKDDYKNSFASQLSARFADVDWMAMGKNEDGVLHLPGGNFFIVDADMDIEVAQDFIQLE